MNNEHNADTSDDNNASNRGPRGGVGSAPVLHAVIYQRGYMEPFDQSGEVLESELYSGYADYKTALNKTAQKRVCDAVQDEGQTTDDTNGIVPEELRKLSPHLGRTLIFDTETTLDPKQEARYGIYQLRGLDLIELAELARKLGLNKKGAKLTPEQREYAMGELNKLRWTGLFYNPRTTTQADQDLMRAYAAKHGILFISSDQFVCGDLYNVINNNVTPAEKTKLHLKAKDKHPLALIIGHNLPFDLGALARRWHYAAPSRKGLNFYGGFVLQLCNCGIDGEYAHSTAAHKKSCRWHQFIKTLKIGAGKHFIQRGAVVDDETGVAYPPISAFLDTRTLFKSMFEGPSSLKAACELLETEDGKLDHNIFRDDPAITVGDLNYCHSDVRATWQLFEKLRDHYKKYGLNAHMDKIYSGASLGKNCLKAMGVRPFMDQHPQFKARPKDLIAPFMAAYFGGLSKVMYRCKPVTGALLDFKSAYPAVHALQDLQALLLAEKIEIIEDVNIAQNFLNRVTLDDLLDNPDSWKNLTGVVKFKADKNILPVRAEYGKQTAVSNIGDNYLSTPLANVWYSIADVVRSKVLDNGRVPEIEAIIILKPFGQYETKEYAVFGKDEYKINLNKEDQLFVNWIDFRDQVKAQAKAVLTEIENLSLSDLRKRNPKATEKLAKILGEKLGDVWCSDLKARQKQRVAELMKEAGISEIRDEDDNLRAPDDVSDFEDEEFSYEDCEENLTLTDRRGLDKLLKKDPEYTRLHNIQLAIKILANATSYGILCEFNVRKFEGKQRVRYHTPYESKWIETKNVEERGTFCAPPIATFITAGCRLMLGIAERLGLDKGLDIVFCDTDSMFYRQPDDMTRKEFTEALKDIQDTFDKLSPYKTGHLFQIEYGADPDDPIRCVAISSKRYALYRVNPNRGKRRKVERGDIELVKASRHGLSHVQIDSKKYKPIDRIEHDLQDLTQWQAEFWISAIVEFENCKSDDERRAVSVCGSDLENITANSQITIAKAGIAKQLAARFVPSGIEGLSDDEIREQTQIRPGSFWTAWGKIVPEDIDRMDKLSDDEKEKLKTTTFYGIDHKNMSEDNALKTARRYDTHELVHTEKTRVHEWSEDGVLRTRRARHESVADNLRGHFQKPEFKSYHETGDGREHVVGKLQRWHVVAIDINYIGKEVDRISGGSGNTARAEAGLIEEHHEAVHLKFSNVTECVKNAADKFTAATVAEACSVTVRTIADVMNGRTPQNRTREKLRLGIANLIKNDGMVLPGLVDDTVELVKQAIAEYTLPEVARLMCVNKPIIDDVLAGKPIEKYVRKRLERAIAPIRERNRITGLNRFGRDVERFGLDAIARGFKAGGYGDSYPSPRHNKTISIRAAIQEWVKGEPCCWLETYNKVIDKLEAITAQDREKAEKLEKRAARQKAKTENAAVKRGYDVSQSEKMDEHIQIDFRTLSPEDIEALRKRIARVGRRPILETMGSAKTEQSRLALKDFSQGHIPDAEIMNTIIAALKACEAELQEKFKPRVIVRADGSRRIFTVHRIICDGKYRNVRNLSEALSRLARKL